MHGWDGRTTAATEEVVTMAFDDGRVVIYDPTNPEAWLMADGR